MPLIEREALLRMLKPVFSASTFPQKSEAAFGFADTSVELLTRPDAEPYQRSRAV